LGVQFPLLSVQVHWGAGTWGPTTAPQRSGALDEPMDADADVDPDPAAELPPTEDAGRDDDAAAVEPAGDEEDSTPPEVEPVELLSPAGGCPLHATRHNAHHVPQSCCRIRPPLKDAANGTHPSAAEATTRDRPVINAKRSGLDGGDPAAARAAP